MLLRTQMVLLAWCLLQSKCLWVAPGYTSWWGFQSLTSLFLSTNTSMPCCAAAGVAPLPSCYSVLGQLWFLQLVRSHKYRAKTKGRWCRGWDWSSLHIRDPSAGQHAGQYRVRVPGLVSLLLCPLDVWPHPTSLTTLFTSSSWIKSPRHL